MGCDYPKWDSPNCSVKSPSQVLPVPKYLGQISSCIHSISTFQVFLSTSFLINLEVTKLIIMVSVFMDSFHEARQLCRNNLRNYSGNVMQRMLLLSMCLGAPEETKHSDTSLQLSFLKERKKSLCIWQYFLKHKATVDSGMIFNSSILEDHFEEAL